VLDVHDAVNVTVRGALPDVVDVLTPQPPSALARDTDASPAIKARSTSPGRRIRPGKVIGGSDGIRTITG